MGAKKSQNRRSEVFARLSGLKPGGRVKLADGWYRMRRGKLVRIPDEWVGRPVEMCGDTRLWREYKLAQRRGHSRKHRRREWFRAGGRVERARQRDYAPTGKMGHPRNRSPRHLSRKDRRDQQDGL